MVRFHWGAPWKPSLNAPIWRNQGKKEADTACVAWGVLDDRGRQTSPRNLPGVRLPGSLLRPLRRRRDLWRRLGPQAVGAVRHLVDPVEAPVRQQELVRPAKTTKTASCQSAKLAARSEIPRQATAMPGGDSSGATKAGPGVPWCAKLHPCAPHLSGVWPGT